MRTFAASLLQLALMLFTVPIVACSDGGGASASPPSEILAPQFTTGSGSTSTLLGRARFSLDENFKVKRMSGDWHVEIKAHPELDLAIQSIVFQPGAYSGWHMHPGPVFIQVATGTMTFYEGDDPSCTPIVRHAGEGFLDTGDHPHIARNESGAPATNVVTYFAPPGASLRIDAPAPGNCPF